MKTKQMFAILAAGSLLAVSCQKAFDEKPDKAVLPDGAVGFNAYTSVPSTKGTVVTVDSVQIGGIGVFTFYQKAVAEQPVLFNTHRFTTPDFMYNQQVTYAPSTGWTYEPLKYWPNNVGDRLSFFAYAPYTAQKRWDDLNITTTSSADRLSVVFNINEDVTTQQDLLWAVPKINQTNKLEDNTNNPAKIIKFKVEHVTAKVGIMLGVTTGQYAEEWIDTNTIILPKCIKFTDLNSQYTYTYPITDGQIDEDKLKVTYCEGKNFDMKVKPDEQVDTISSDNWVLTPKGVLNSEKYAPYLPKDQYMFLAPQTFTDQTVSITYVVKTTDPNSKMNSSTITNTITKDLKDVLAKADGKFEAGKAYNLKFLIGMDDVNISASIIDWDEDIYEKEIYTPGNYVVMMYNGNDKYADSEIKAATFNKDSAIFINVRDIDLSSDNTGIYRVLDYAVDTTEYKDLDNSLLAMAGTSESDLKLKEVKNAITDFVTTKAVTFDNKTAKIDAGKLQKDSVYVFKYTYASTGAVNYTVFKTGPMGKVSTSPKLTMVPNGGFPTPAQKVEIGDTLEIAVSDNGSPVKGLRRSCFKITDTLHVAVEDAFDFKSKSNGKYAFIAKMADTTRARFIYVRGDSLKVKVVKPVYKFSMDTLVIGRGFAMTDSLMKDSKVASKINVGFKLAYGNRGFRLVDISNGAVTVAADKAITRDAVDTLKFIKSDMTLATAVVRVAAFSVSADKKVFFSNGNLYYDGSAFKFEDKQYSIDTAYVDNHVSHFKWANKTVSLKADIQNAISKTSAAPDSAKGTSDVFFTNATADTPRTDFIANGEKGVWRTLSGTTDGEWNYLLKVRKINGNASYKIAKIKLQNGDKVHGLVIYPDNFTYQIPDADASNGISLDKWTVLESCGCVFLPAAGERTGTSYSKEAAVCRYWSSSPGADKDTANGIVVSTDITLPASDNRKSGLTVRLVSDVK